MPPRLTFELVCLVLELSRRNACSSGHRVTTPAMLFVLRNLSATPLRVPNGACCVGLPPAGSVAEGNCTPVLWRVSRRGVDRAI